MSAGSPLSQTELAPASPRRQAAETDETRTPGQPARAAARPYSQHHQVPRRALLLLYLTHDSARKPHSSTMALTANAAALVLAGDALMEQGRYDEAEDNLRAAIEANPNDAPAHYALGKCLGASHDVRGSEHAYRTALQLDPDDPDAGNALGLMLWRARGDLQGAEAAFRAVVRAHPKRMTPRVNLDRLLRMKLPSKGGYRKNKQNWRTKKRDGPQLRPERSERGQKNWITSKRKAMLSGAVEGSPLEPRLPGIRPSTSTKQPGDWAGFRSGLGELSYESGPMASIDGLDGAIANPGKVLAMLHPSLRTTTPSQYDFRPDRSAYLQSRELPKRLQRDFVHLAHKTAPRNARTRQMARRAKTPSSMLGTLPNYDKWKPSGYLDPFRSSFNSPYKRSHGFAMWTAPPGTFRKRGTDAFEAFDENEAVTEKIVGFPDGKEGCELFVGEKATAYELREDGDATGEVRVVLGKVTADVGADAYAPCGYDNVEDLSWDEKAALGALLANVAADEGVEALTAPAPPFPAGAAVSEHRPTGAAALRIMMELDGEV